VHLIQAEDRDIFLLDIYIYFRSTYCDITYITNNIRGRAYRQL